MARKVELLPVMNFRVASTGCEIKLVRLQIRETGGPKLLSRPIYEFAYVNRDANRANAGKDKPPFTTYKEEIDRCVNMETWIKI